MALKGSRRCGALLLACLSGALLGAAPADPQRAAREAEAEARLVELRERIAALTSERREQEESRDAVITALREADEAVARERSALDALATRRVVLEDRLAQQQAVEADARQALAVEREALATMLRAAYASGAHEGLRRLLSPVEGQSLAAALADLRYLQAGRRARVERALAAERRLAEARMSLETARAGVAEAEGQRLAGLTALEAARQGQADALRAIESDLVDQQRRLAALGRDAEVVEALLAQLRDALADIPRQLSEDRPFSTRRGQLARPADGRVEGRFGGQNASGRLQEGLWFRTEEGRPVRSVAPGRVAYADWLRGYGLLVIIDHGGGWMSLYAHNARIRTAVGDWISGGQTLAEVGRSGGQARPGLYFELRRDGQPVDPGPWLAAR